MPLFHRPPSLLYGRWIFPSQARTTVPVDWDLPLTEYGADDCVDFA